MRADLEPLPLWIKGGVVGVLCVVMGFLTYQITVERKREFEELRVKQDEHELNRLRDMQQMNAFMYAICLNTAQDSTALARCAIALDGGLNARRAQ